MSDDNIEDKQDIKDEKRVKNDAERHDKQVDDQVQFARRKMHAPGLKATSSNASTDTPDGVDRLETKEEKESRRIFDTIRLLDSVNEEMKGIFAEMDAILAKMRENAEKIRAGQRAKEFHDVEGARLFLLSTDKYTQSQIDGMSEQDLFDAVDVEIENTKLDQEALNTKYNDLANRGREMAKDSPEAATLMKAFDDLEAQAEKEGLDLWVARKEHRVSQDAVEEIKESSVLGDRIIAERDDDHYSHVKASQNTSNAFAAVASRTSIAKDVAPDETSKTRSISSPFNKVASQIGIEPKTQDPAPETTTNPQLSTPGLG